MFGAGPSGEIGSTFANELERERRAQPVYLSEIDPKHGMERRPHIEGRRVWLFCRMPGRRQLARWFDDRRLQAVEDSLHPHVALGDLRLVDVVEFKRLAQRKNVFLAAIACQRGSDRLHRRVTARVPVRGQNFRVALACDDGADDAHASYARDVGDDVMDLQVHLRQRLLHVLNVSCGVIQQPFPLTQVRAQNCNLAFRLEAAADQAVGMQSLEPLRVADVGLAAGDVLGVTGVD